MVNVGEGVRSFICAELAVGVVLCYVGEVLLCSGQIMMVLPGVELFSGLVEIAKNYGGAASDQFSKMPAGDCIHDILTRVFSAAASSQECL